MYFVPSPLQPALANVNPATAGMMLQPATPLSLVGDPATLFGTPAAPPSYDAIVLNPNGPRSQTNLFVRKLASAVTEAEMTKMFAPYGTVVSLALMRNIHSGESLGTAFVRYETHEQARAAMAALDGAEMYGRNISIQWAKRQHDGTPVGEARQKIHKLFVRNVPVDVTGRQLRQVFAQYGTIVNVTLLNDTAADTSRTASHHAHSHAHNGEHDGGGGATTTTTTPERNIAFILFQEDGAAEKAVRGQHNTCPFPTCEGIPLMVKLAEDNRQRLERRQRYGDTSNQAILLPTPLMPPLSLLQQPTPGASAMTPSLLLPPHPSFAAATVPPFGKNNNNNNNGNNNGSNNKDSNNNGSNGTSATLSSQVSPYTNGLSLSGSFVYHAPPALATANNNNNNNMTATTAQTPQQPSQTLPSMSSMSQLFATSPMPGFVYTAASPSSCFLAPTPAAAATTTTAMATSPHNNNNNNNNNNGGGNATTAMLSPAATGMYIDPNLSFSMPTGLLATPMSPPQPPPPSTQQQQQQQQPPMPYYVTASLSPMYVPLGGAPMQPQQQPQQLQQPMQYVFAQPPSTLTQPPPPPQQPSPCTATLPPPPAPLYGTYMPTAPLPSPPCMPPPQQQAQHETTTTVDDARAAATDAPPQQQQAVLSTPPRRTAAAVGDVHAAFASADAQADVDERGILSYDSDSNHDADTVMPISSNFMDDLMCSSVTDT